MLNAALIGFGGIAQAAHSPAYASLEKKGKVRLVAAYDIDPARFGQKMTINIGSSDGTAPAIRFYTDLEEMLAKEDIQLLDICLPTFLHASMTADMLRRGYHVLSEKPMARTYADCLTMVEAAKNAKGKLMIAQCVRFFPEYIALKKLLDEGTYGRPLSAVFRRMSEPPVWGWDNWYMDEARSGGCLLDLHIHDIDVIRYFFGEPQTVSCVSQTVYSGFDILHSQLYYPDFSVLAVGDWSQHGVPFSADYRVALEKATVISGGGRMTVYPRDGEPFSPELSSVGGYEGEIEYFVDTIAAGSVNSKNPPESAATTIKLIDTLRDSALHNGEKTAFRPDRI